MTPRVFCLAILLIALVSPAFAIGGGGAAACGRCEIPYPDAYQYADSSGVPMTASEAATFCFERLDDLPFGMEFGGYVIQWVGAPPASEEGTGVFYCHACINDLSGGSTGPGLPFDQAGWVALEAYPGRISTISSFFVDDEAYGVGVGYLVTIVDPDEGDPDMDEDDDRAAIVRVDPFTGQAKVLREETTRP